VAESHFFMTQGMLFELFQKPIGAKRTSRNFFQKEKKSRLLRNRLSRGARVHPVATAPGGEAGSLVFLRARVGF
jgi:hypothetical protein